MLPPGPHSEILDDMEIVPIELKILVPTPNGTAIFVGNDEKVFVIYVDNAAGTTLADTLAGVDKERPMTHDLIGHIFTGFGVGVERVVINHADNGIFHARLILSMRNEIGTKLVELDARPSDAFILAVRDKKPLFVTREVFEALEDMSEVLRKITEQQKP